MARSPHSAAVSPSPGPGASRRDHGDLTLAVIHFQTPELLDGCLEALRAAAPAARILVVDTSEHLPLGDEWAREHRGVELLRQPNHSYAAAVNAALRVCSTPRFCQLNADVIVEQGTFDDLAAAMDASGAAMAGPLARDRNGRVQRNGLPYRWHQWRASRASGRLVAGSGSPRGWQVGVSDAPHGGSESSSAPGWHAAPWLSGCLQYLRMDAVESVGGMDTSLRFYNEDLEWCLRLRATGERCVLVGTWITHLGGSSTPSSAEPIVEGLRGGYLITRRYRGPVARSIHRWGVFAATSVLGVAGRKPHERRAYRRVAKMMLRNDFEESPFGESLGSENPAFLARGRSA